MPKVWVRLHIRAAMKRRRPDLLPKCLSIEAIGGTCVDNEALGW